MIHKLVGQNDFFSAIFETLADAFFVIDIEEERIVYANKKALQTLEYTLEEMQELKLSEWQRSIEGETFKDHVTLVREGVRTFVNRTLLTKSSQRLFVECHCNLTSYEGVDYLISIARRRPQIQSVLQQSILNDIADAAYFADETSKIVFTNKTAIERTGYTREELLNMHIKDVDPDFNPAQWPELMKALDNGPVLVKTNHQKKNGEIYPVEVNIAKVSVDDMSYLLGIARDMTEHEELLNSIDTRSRQLDIIGNFQTEFISRSDPFDMYARLRDELIHLTDSKIGFIGETSTKNGEPMLKIYALSNIAWDADTRRLYQRQQDKGFEFTELNNLLGRVILDRKVVLSNDPLLDPRSGGLPKGHPKIESFLGIPVFSGNKIVGEIGLANRPGGYDEEVVKLINPLAKTLGQIIVARQESEAREKAEEQLRKMVHHDALTGLYNRGYFNETVLLEWRRCVRSGLPLSIIMLDIDFFKNYNDTYGHLKGDACLITISETLEACIRRAGEFVARYGGEEFVALLPNTTMENALEIAKCFQSRLEQKAIAHEDSKVSPYVTISIGVASMVPKPEDDVRNLINTADKYLYQAKAEGRNKIVYK